jgi:hypothetical protein
MHSSIRLGINLSLDTTNNRATHGAEPRLRSLHPVGQPKARLPQQQRRCRCRRFHLGKDLSSSQAEIGRRSSASLHFQRENISIWVQSQHRIVLGYRISLPESDSLLSVGYGCVANCWARKFCAEEMPRGEDWCSNFEDKHVATCVICQLLVPAVAAKAVQFAQQKSWSR